MIDLSQSIEFDQIPRAEETLALFIIISLASSPLRENEARRESFFLSHVSHFLTKKLLFPGGRFTRKDGENTHKHTLSLSEARGALVIGKNVIYKDVVGAHRRGSET